MNGTNRCRAFAYITALAVVFLAVGCGGGGDDDDDNGGNGTVVGCTPAADSILALANAELESVLYAELNRTDDIEHPGEVDFSAAHDLYLDALDEAPDCPTANFGAAVTDLLTLSVDPDVEDAFDEWEAYLDDYIPFEAGSGGKAPLGIPISLSRGTRSLRLPFDLVPLSALAVGRASMKAADGDVPRIGDVQDLLVNTVLPRANQAIERLDKVTGEYDFNFAVSGKMQGDQEEEAAYIDRTDVLGLRAGCHLLAAAIEVAAAYQLELTAYDSLTLLQAMQPGSGWFSLKSGGTDRMKNAFDRLLDSVDDLDSAIVSLLREDDPQYDDIIKIGPDDRPAPGGDVQIGEADVDSIRYNLDAFRDAMRSSTTRVDDWDDDSTTVEEALEISFYDIFQNPITDWKTLLPDYTASVIRWLWEEDSSGPSSPSSWDPVLLTVDVPSGGEYSVDVRLRLEYGASEYEVEAYGSSFLTDVCEDTLRARLDPLRQAPDLIGEIYGRIYGGWELLPGVQTIEGQITTSYEAMQPGDRWVYIPVITWDAASFDEWEWPDPTMHGVFPGMTSTDDLWDIFGIEARQWERSWNLDWTEGEWDWDLGDIDVGEGDEGGDGPTGPTDPIG